MLFSKEYVGYLAREVSKKLVASGLIETKAMPALNEKVHAALLDELALEDQMCIRDRTSRSASTGSAAGEMPSLESASAAASVLAFGEFRGLEIHLMNDPSYERSMRAPACAEEPD